MIDLHFWQTPNGQKVSIALEELDLPYKVLPVNIGKGDQFKPEFLAISPNNRIPAIVDHEPKGGGSPIAIFESGAILIYLAEKVGRLLPTEPRERAETLQWLMWQMGGVGPMFGQANHFIHYAPEKIPYGIERYTKEVHRLLKVLETRLADREYLAGAYSIADIATFTWIAGTVERLKLPLEEHPHITRWVQAIGERPAVVRGLAVNKDAKTAELDAEARRHLFGASK